ARSGHWRSADYPGATHLSDAVVKGCRAVAALSNPPTKHFFVEFGRPVDVGCWDFDVADFSVCECWGHNRVLRLARPGWACQQLDAVGPINKGRIFLCGLFGVAQDVGHRRFWITEEHYRLFFADGHIPPDELRIDRNVFLSLDLRLKNRIVNSHAVVLTGMRFELLI